MATTRTAPGRWAAPAGCATAGSLSGVGLLLVSGVADRRSGSVRR